MSGHLIDGIRVLINTKLLIASILTKVILSSMLLVILLKENITQFINKLFQIKAIITSNNLNNIIEEVIVAFHLSYKKGITFEA